jgi:hypothetical protein
MKVEKELVEIAQVFFYVLGIIGGNVKKKGERNAMGEFNGQAVGKKRN